jgi:hypothetical protein
MEGLIKQLYHMTEESTIDGVGHLTATIENKH